MREAEGTANEAHGDPEEEPIMYDLFAVDEHLGGLGGGHYRAYAKNYADGQWYHYDDSHVSPTDPQQAVNRNAYLLFYRRRTSLPIGGKTSEKIEEARKAPTAEPIEQLTTATTAAVVDADDPFTDDASTRRDHGLQLPMPTLLAPDSGMISPASSQSSESQDARYSPSPPAFDLSGNDQLLLSSTLELDDADTYSGQLVLRGAAPSPFNGSTSAEMGDSGIMTPADSEMDTAEASAPAESWDDDQAGETGRFAKAYDDDLIRGYLPTPPDVEMGDEAVQKQDGASSAPMLGLKVDAVREPPLSTHASMGD